MNFDPFTATLDDALAQPDAHALHGPVIRWGVAQAILEKRARYEEFPIEGVSRCVRHGLIAPDWLAVAFIRQYDKVLNWRVGSWEEAFGTAKPQGFHLTTLRLRREHGLKLHLLFDGPDALPRTPAGRCLAAKMLGLSEKQVRTLLPRTRKNSKGSEAYRSAVPTAARAAGVLDHDPFSLATKKPKI